jgi:hypothetical protein
MSKKTLSYKRSFASQRTRWFFPPRIGNPSGRGVLCSGKNLIRSRPGNPSPGSRERGKKALSARGGISYVPQMEKGTIGARGWRANGKKRGPKSFETRRTRNRIGEGI